MAKFAAAAALLLFLLCLDAAAGRKEPQQFEELCFKNLKPQPKPRVAFQSDAGMLEVWGEEYPAMKDANVVAGRLTLKPGALIMPAYVDIPAMKIVMQGNISVGILDQVNQGKVYQLKVGDLVALPSGVPTWWFNHGDQDALVLCVGDSSSSPEPANVTPFMLAGGKTKSEKKGEVAGGVLQGFSTKFLAQAWEMSETDTKKIVSSQQEQLFKLVPGLRLPAVTTESSTNSTNLIYHYADAVPDLVVEQGGQIRELNSLKMPVLRNLKMGAECVKLAGNAMIAPSWFHNGHQILYSHTGSGKLQVVSSSGDRILDLDLVEGSLVVVPKFFPATVIAGPKGLQFVSFVTNDRPLVSFLAGSNSVYRGIPSPILSSLFNVDDQTALKLQQSTSKNSIIVPSRKSRKPMTPQPQPQPQP